MKNIDTTAKFDFKKTTITVFSKQPSPQAKLFSDEAETSSLPCATIIVVTGIFTSC